MINTPDTDRNSTNTDNLPQGNNVSNNDANTTNGGTPPAANTETVAASQEACSGQCTCERPCRCLPPYSVAVTVVTRLGGFPLRGARVAIVDKTASTATNGAEDVRLNFPDATTISRYGETDDEGFYANKSIRAGSIEVWVSYENRDENLKEEIAKIYINGPLVPICSALNQLPGSSNVMNQIWKVHDVQNDDNDINFFESRNFIIDNNPPAEMGPHRPTRRVVNFVENAGTQQNADIIKNSRIKAVYEPEAEAGRRLTLLITVVLDTFSLQVPYVNQNMGSVVLFTYPASTGTTRPANNSPLFGYPTLTETSIVFGTAASSRTAQTAMATNGWPIDTDEQDYVYEQIRSRLPSTAAITALNSQLTALELLPPNPFNMFMINNLRAQIEALTPSCESLRDLLGCIPTHATTIAHSATCTQRYIPHLRSGSDLCFPTTVTMLLLYHGYNTGNIPRLRAELMRKSYENATATFSDWSTVTMYNDTASSNKPWQTAEIHMQNAINCLMGEQVLFGRTATNTGPTNNITALHEGLPVVVSIVGHIILVRGAVVKMDGNAEWFICNDPQGNLAGVDSNYDIQSGYKETENEINLHGQGNEAQRTRGRHVYYKSGITHRRANTKVSFSYRLHITRDRQNAIDVKTVLIYGVPRDIPPVLYHGLDSIFQQNNMPVYA